MDELIPKAPAKID
jgi:hypothetical protein